jgi:hypothetical protein
LKNTKIKETMFLFNQRLLPTRARDHRIDSTTDPTCCFCNQEPESDEHIMLHCPSREISTLWLERTLRIHGCSTIPMDFIRGQLGPVRNPRTSFALVAAYIYPTWKERSEGPPLKQRAYGLQYFDLVNPKTQPQCVLFYSCHFCHFVYFCFVLFTLCTNYFLVYVLL